MKLTRALFALLFAFFAFVSCESDFEDPAVGPPAPETPTTPTTPGTPEPPTTPPAATAVYVVGTHSPGSNAHAYYWKNGVGTALPEPAGSFSSRAMKVMTVGTDVFIAGLYVLSAGTAYHPIVWKNGSIHFADASGDNSAMVGFDVSGSDVYVAGEIYTLGPAGATSQSGYWKNGVFTPGPPGFRVVDIDVSGSDVYTLYYQSGMTTNQCMYTKNGVPVYFPPSVEHRTSKIKVLGSDVYVAGFDAINDKALFWKNGTLTVLPGTKAMVSSLEVASNGDVYITGFEELTMFTETACYWKNGVRNSLGAANEYELYGCATSGTDFYLTGHYTQGIIDGAFSWKNGTRTQLPGSYTEGRDIALGL